MTLFDAATENLLDEYEADFDPAATQRLSRFFPARSSTTFAEVAIELIRIDMELSWAAGVEKTVHTYESLLPELATHPEMRAAVAFEEYRQRQARGETGTLTEFANQYRIASADWTTVVQKHDETTVAHSFDDLVSSIPSTGDRWRDFVILREIGRGALSRVLLARQESLSNRMVVLKFEPKSSIEAENVAKLHHPNIVTVFSVHEDDRFHVFCMPFVGEKTLAHSIEDGVSERRALELTEELALAIAHAHEKGILHHDIKPANVLIDDQQRPRLIDFNLSVDTREQFQLNAGGTLPYMSPEALRNLNSEDIAETIGSTDNEPEPYARSDIYSLGVVFYELVTGKLPFGKSPNIIEQLERRNDKFDESELKRFAPSTVAILKKCLSHDVDERYPSARQLAEDIQRHRNHRMPQFAKSDSIAEPFMKWSQRHPRLSSSTAMACMTTALLAAVAVAWVARGRYVAKLEANAQYESFQTEFQELMPQLSVGNIGVFDSQEALASADKLLAQYIADPSRPSERPEAINLLEATDVGSLEQDLQRLALLSAENHLRIAERSDGDSSLQHRQSATEWNAVCRSLNPKSRAVQLQHAQLLKSIDEMRAIAASKLAISLTPVDANDYQICGVIQRRAGDLKAALRMLTAATDESPRDFSKWLDLAMVQRRLGMLSDAEESLSKCLLLRPKSSLATYARAMVRTSQSKHSEAIEDYTAFLTHAPNHPAGLLNRAIAHKSLGSYKAALADLDAAIAAGHDGSRPFIIRSRVKGLLSDWRGAKDDRRKGLAATPNDALGWDARGIAVMADDPKAALADFERAIELDPDCISAHNNAAYLLSEKLDDVPAAIEHMNHLVGRYPNNATAISGRSVLFARTGDMVAALADVAFVEVAEDATPRDLIRAASALSIASGVAADPAKLKQRAISLTARAFRQDVTLAKLVRTDSDLRAIRNDKTFRGICDAARKLERSSKVVEP